MDFRLRAFDILLAPGRDPAEDARMTWSRVRRWKRGVAAALLLGAAVLLHLAPESSTAWKAGIVLAVGLGLAYLAEELIWITQRQGRPCGRCGQKVPLKAFRVTTSCPHCGQPFE
jgi:hypothetical protein